MLTRTPLITSLMAQAYLLVVARPVVISGTLDTAKDASVHKPLSVKDIDNDFVATDNFASYLAAPFQRLPYQLGIKKPKVTGDADQVRNLATKINEFESMRLENLGDHWNIPREPVLDAAKAIGMKPEHRHKLIDNLIDRKDALAGLGYWRTAIYNDRRIKLDRKGIILSNGGKKAKASESTSATGAIESTGREI